MSWVRLDDGFFRNRKAREAGKDGRALYLAGCCYSAAALTDGHIAKRDLAVLCAEAEVKPAVARRLVEVGMWIELDDGWLINDFTEFNPTAESVKEKRRLAKERQDRWKAKRDASRNASANGPKDAAPYPLPTPPPKGAGRVSGPKASATSPQPSAGDEQDAEEERVVLPEVLEAIRAARNGLRAQPAIGRGA